MCIRIRWINSTRLCRGGKLWIVDKGIDWQNGKTRLAGFGLLRANNPIQSLVLLTNVFKMLSVCQSSPEFCCFWSMPKSNFPFAVQAENGNNCDQTNINHKITPQAATHSSQ